MSRYAEGTEVAADRSRAEIEGILRRYGATAFNYGWRESRAQIAFEVDGRTVRFILPLPDPSSDMFCETPSGNKRSPEAADREYDKEVRRRWRALALVVKAKMEATASGISSFEDEFLSHFVTNSGETIGERIRPHLDKVLETGSLPLALPPPRSES